MPLSRPAAPASVLLGHLVFSLPLLQFLCGSQILNAAPCRLDVINGKLKPTMRCTILTCGCALRPSKQKSHSFQFRPCCTFPWKLASSCACRPVCASHSQWALHEVSAETWVVASGPWHVDIRANADVVNAEDAPLCWNIHRTGLSNQLNGIGNDAHVVDWCFAFDVRRGRPGRPLDGCFIRCIVASDDTILGRMRWGEGGGPLEQVALQDLARSHLPCQHGHSRHRRRRRSY